MEMGAADTAQLMDLLSRERLHALLSLTGDEAAAIDLHQRALGVGGELMKVIATIEIALRNAVVANLGRHFGVQHWLQQPPVHFRWRDMERNKIKSAIDSARRAEYSKLSQAQKSALDSGAYPNGRPAHVSHLQRSKARRALIGVTDGKVVAELTFLFWKRLYGPEYEQSLWRPSLKRTFPNKALKRAQIATHLEVIYQARNRLAHHEPVLHQRFADTIEAVRFVVGELSLLSAPPTPLMKLLDADIAGAVAAEAALSVRLDSYRA